MKLRPNRVPQQDAVYNGCQKTSEDESLSRRDSELIWFILQMLKNAEKHQKTTFLEQTSFAPYNSGSKSLHVMPFAIKYVNMLNYFQLQGHLCIS